LKYGTAAGIVVDVVVVRGIVVVVGGTVVVVGGTVVGGFVVEDGVSNAAFLTVLFWQTTIPLTNVHTPVMPYSLHVWPTAFCAVTRAAANAIRGEQMVVPDPPKAVHIPSIPPTEQSLPTVFRD
jgi:hypothetical protein